MMVKHLIDFFFFLVFFFWEGGVRNGVFPAISISKDLTAIRDSRPPNVNFWAQRAPVKNNACNPAVVRLLPLPREELKDVKNQVKDAGPIAEMHTKGMISVSPDSCIFPHILQISDFP